MEKIFNWIVPDLITTWSILGTMTIILVHIYEDGEGPNRKHDVHLAGRAALQVRLY